MIVPMPPAFDLLAEPPSGVFHYNQSSWGPNPLGTCLTVCTITGGEKKHSDKWNSIESGRSDIYTRPGHTKKNDRKVGAACGSSRKDN